MITEDQVTQLLSRAVAARPAGPPPVAVLVEGGTALRRRRRRKRVAMTGAAILALVLGGTAIARTLRSADDVRPAQTVGEWRELPTPPLSPRRSAFAAWTGTEAIFVGGTSDPPCEGFGPCPESAGLRDGAAYDPTSETWRTIASAPTGLSAGTSYVVWGGSVFVHPETNPPQILEYNPKADTWTQLTSTPPSVETTGPTPVDGRPLLFVWKFFAGHETVVLYAFDPSTQTWSTLPPVAESAMRNPGNGPMSTTPGIVIVNAPSGTKGEPDMDTAMIFDGQGWRSAPASNFTTGNDWWWTGRRLVSPTTHFAARGDLVSGAFDPSTDTWTQLPLGPVPEDTAGWDLRAIEGPLFAINGYLYDDRNQHWSTLPFPTSNTETPPSEGTAAVWANGDVIAFGGSTRPRPTDDPTSLNNQAWLLRPDWAASVISDSGPS